MTDDAIGGEQGVYVPCDELAAALAVEQEGAISGLASGFVAKDDQAAALPDEVTGAIVGSGVGRVAGPCACCCETFTRVEASDWGTSEICPHPDWLTDVGHLGLTTEVDGSAGRLAWIDDFNPGHLTTAQYLELAFTGPPIVYRARIKTTLVPDCAIWLSSQPFFTGGGGPSSWKVDFIGFDLRITVDGPGFPGGVAQNTLGGAYSAYDTYFWLQVLCEPRAMHIKTWADGDPEPAAYQITAGPYSSSLAPVDTPTLIEFMGGTFFGSGLSGSMTVDELCFLQGYPC